MKADTAVSYTTRPLFFVAHMQQQRLSRSNMSSHLEIARVIPEDKHFPFKIKLFLKKACDVLLASLSKSFILKAVEAEVFDIFLNVMTSFAEPPSQLCR